MNSAERFRSHIKISSSSHRQRRIFRPRRFLGGSLGRIPSQNINSSDSDLRCSTQSCSRASSARNSKLQWVQENGKPFSVPGSPGVFGTEINSLELVLGWGYDTRNRVLFPDNGMQLSLNLNAALPGSDVEYFVSRLDFTK